MGVSSELRPKTSKSRVICGGSYTFTDRPPAVPARDAAVVTAHHGTGPSLLKKRPVGPSLATCAISTITVAPSWTVWNPA